MDTTHVSSQLLEMAFRIREMREICGFSKPVLIVHGTGDRLVDIRYSRRAAQEYPNCHLVEVKGDHGFIFSGFAAGRAATIEFLREK